jgi:hypothetical protein
MFNYEEVSHLPKSEQKALIQHARYTAFTKLGFGPRAVGYFVFSAFIGIVVGLISSRLFGGYAAPGLGALAMVWCYQLLLGPLISKGIEHVLSQNS